MKLYPPRHICLPLAGAIRPSMSPALPRINPSAVLAWALRGTLIVILALAAFA